MLVLNWLSPAPFILSGSLVYGMVPSIIREESLRHLSRNILNGVPTGVSHHQSMFTLWQCDQSSGKKQLKKQSKFWLKCESSVYHNGEDMAVRLACRGGSGNRGLLTHILEVQEVQPGCKCQGSPLHDPFPPGRLHFCKVSVSQTQPSSRHLVFKHWSLWRQFTFTQQNQKHPPSSIPEVREEGC